MLARSAVEADTGSKIVYPFPSGPQYFAACHFSARQCFLPLLDCVQRAIRLQHFKLAATLVSFVRINDAV